MKIDGAQRRPVPHCLRKHAEGDHDIEGSGCAIELGMERGILQLLRLKDAVLEQWMLQCILLHRAHAQLLTTTSRTIRRGDDRRDIEARVHQCIE